MADGQGTFGGDGSVHWEIEVKDGDTVAIEVPDHGKPREYKAKSRDAKGNVGQYFKVTIKVPNGPDQVIYVKIETVKNQIKVEWPFDEKDVPRR